MARSPRRPVALAIALSASALASSACGGKATKQDCEQMLDKYLDMVMAEEPDADKLPADQKKAVRDMKRAVRKAEPSYQKVFAQCEAEITKKEYRCAMAAPNPNVWESCID